MNVAPAGAELSFVASFDAANLHVAMSVYDTTDSSAVLVQGPTAMPLLYGNTYVGKFTPSNGKSYALVKAVYTTSGFTVLDSQYQEQSESIFAQYLSPPAQTLVGVVECNGGES